MVPKSSRWARGGGGLPDWDGRRRPAGDEEVVALTMPLGKERVTHTHTRMLPIPNLSIPKCVNNYSTAIDNPWVSRLCNKPLRMGGGLQAKPERAGDLLVVRELRHHHRCGAVLLGSSLPVNSIAATAVLLSACQLRCRSTSSMVLTCAQSLAAPLATGDLSARPRRTPRRGRWPPLLMDMDETVIICIYPTYTQV